MVEFHCASCSPAQGHLIPETAVLMSLLFISTPYKNGKDKVTGISVRIDRVIPLLFIFPRALPLPRASGSVYLKGSFPQKASPEL